MKSKLEFYNEMNKHLLEDHQPSYYFNNLSDERLMQEPFDSLYKLKTTEQSPIHHPEGSVWNHTMLVVDEAATVRLQSKNPKVFMLAALLHDTGKPDTTKKRKGKITSYDHDKIGADKTKKFLSNFSDDINFIDEVAALVRWHMQILFVMNNLPFADMEGMKREVSISEIALLGLCDRLGRTGVDRKKEEEQSKEFISKMRRS